MEVAAANFQTLFNFAQAQVADPEAFADSGEATQRKARRPKGHEHVPIKSPTGTRYHIEAKGGWVKCRKQDPSGSGNSARRKRSFLRISAGIRAGKIRKVKADKQLVTAEQVLGRDDDSISHVSRGRSDSEGQ